MEQHRGFGLRVRGCYGHRDLDCKRVSATLRVGFASERGRTELLRAIDEAWGSNWRTSSRRNWECVNTRP